ncbi:MAG: M6 family metalloprotease domain-containing protein [Prevotella sp.]|nr:M6 family metalloprotease domain-containing protein [Prevotella sp.]
MPDLEVNAPQGRRVQKRLPAINQTWDSTRIYKQLVVLLQFKGDSTYFKTEKPRELYDSLFNVPGYHQRNGAGCVADYFKCQSNGLFNLEFDVYGPYTVSKKSQPIENPNKETRNYGKDALAEATQLFLADHPEIDYSQYDWNGNGYMNQILFVYAGYTGNIRSEKSYGHIWPHTSSYKTITTPDEIKISDYTASAELWVNDTSCGIGTICHEFSHSLGLPDIYPTNGWLYSAVDEWDLMDGGNFTNYGWCPPNYSPQEKMAMGWLKPIELTEPASIIGLKSIADEGEIYIIKHTDEEYYLLENRQWKGFDYALPGKGLLIWHILYRPNEWSSNTPNNTNGELHYELVNADDLDFSEWEQLIKQRGWSSYQNSHRRNNYHLSSSAYPCITDSISLRNDSLTNTSVPASVMITRNAAGENLLSKPITDIRMTEDGLISFNFMGGDPEILEVKHPFNDRKVALYYQLDGTLHQQNSKKGIYILRREDGKMIKFIK